MPLIYFFLFKILVSLFSFFFVSMPYVMASVDKKPIGHDPTKPIYSESTPSQSLTKEKKREDMIVQLQSIFYSDDRKIAIINGKLLEEGDVLGGVSINKINKDSVLVRVNNHSKKLFISKKIIINGMTGVVSE